MALKQPYNTPRAIPEVFVEEKVRLHGKPISMASYRDPLFIQFILEVVFQDAREHVKDEYNISLHTDGQMK